MKKIENLTNLYSVSKTLRFKLIPVGKTEEYFAVKHYLATDEKLAEDYIKMKGEIIACHRKFIDECLSSFAIDSRTLDEYYSIYKKSERSEGDKKVLVNLQKDMKSALAVALKPDNRDDRFFGKGIIDELLANAGDNETQQIISSFAKFTTYFTGFNDNIKNIYSNKNKSTEIVYRLINQNLNKFLDNCKINDKYNVLDNLSSQLDELYRAMSTVVPTPFISSDDLKNKIFEPEYFNSLLTQSGIDLYNQLIGGFTTDDKKKIKGINEYINEYNQTHDNKIPKLKQLYKQILSERASLSFIPEKFNSDSQVLLSINEFYDIIKPNFAKIEDLFTNILNYDTSRIYVKSSELSTISNKIFGDWSVIRNYLYDEYDKAHSGKKIKDIEKYEDDRRKALNKIKSYSLADIFRCVNEDEFANRINCDLKDNITSIINCASHFSTLSDTSKLLGDEGNTETIKNLLDAIMQLKSTFSVFNVESNESKDEMFYGIYDEINDSFNGITKLYDKVRNYLTQKLYSQDKIKLNFGNSQLFNGWDLNKEKDYQTVMLRKDNNYYVGIIDRESKDIFQNMPKYSGGSCYEKMIYKLLPSPNKMLPKVIFAKSNSAIFQPSKEINDIYARKATCSLDECHILIDYFKSCLKKYEGWNCYDFHFSDTSTYKDINDFYKEVAEQGYKVNFIPVDESYIDDCIEQGKLLLFQVYSKDFSEYSNGKKNLHTLYFTQLFSDENLANPTFLLNGGAEMFYRFASPKLDSNKVTHPKNQPIKNKNPLNTKKESIFAYDLIKDKRYTKAQFSLHVPIKINAFDGDSGYNKVSNRVKTALCDCDDNYVIGIDRGERNLLYVCVIDGKGNIVEQFSLNTIEDDCNSNIKTDYHSLLSKREDERLEARQSWKSINGIANLKRGYLSQVVHKICLIVEKYDAVIAMEDLNSGFKNSRKKVEKSVYQEFEKALIEKLNFLSFKDRQPNEIGGLRHAYQLTDKFESFQKIKQQNGIIFYIPAWCTSKIDPSTGFVNMLNINYSSVDSAVSFFSKFDSIYYDSQRDMFAFPFDYTRFGANVDYKNKWTVYTYGDRIETFRTNNNQFDCRTVFPAELLKSAFESVGITYSDGHNLVDDICAVKSKDFYVKILYALKLTLQMRNSNSKTGEDYIISPVLNSQGQFFDSRNYSGRNATKPVDADANGAYHIARKCLWAVNQIKAGNDNRLSITKKEWLEYMQRDNQ